jgi:hypothetical protein
LPAESAALESAMITQWLRQSIEKRSVAPPRFIWIAAETSSSEVAENNLRLVEAALLGTGKSDYIQLARRLRDDRRLFHAAVQMDRSALEFALTEGAEFEPFLFTNEASQRGVFEVYDKTTAEFVDRPFELPAANDPILRDNPLSRPDALDLVLDRVAGLLLEGGRDVILVLKGHGNGRQLLRPLVSIDAARLSMAEVVQRAESFKKNFDEVREADDIFGIGKEQLLASLERAHERHGMRFPIVFLESCKAAIPDELIGKIPACVDNLCYLEKPVGRYVNILYGDLTPSPKFGHGFTDQLLGELSRKCKIACMRRLPATKAELLVRYSWTIAAIVIVTWWWLGVY